jgi:hypothetical protein
MDLSNVLESDFDDAILAGLSEDEIAGLLEAAPKKAKKALAKKVKASATKQNLMMSSTPANSRGELTRRFNLLPQDIQDGLTRRRLQASDGVLYAIKSVAGAKSVKMFRDDDNKVTGMCNISSGKLEKGSFFLMNEIVLLSGLATSDDANAGTTSTFHVIDTAIRNGELELRVNGAAVLTALSTEVFNTTGNRTGHTGLYRLDNPKLINEQQGIEVNLEWANPAPARMWLKVLLKGTIIMKN